MLCVCRFFFFFSVSRPIRFLEGKVNPSGENPISYVPAAAFDYVIRRTKKLKWDVNYRPMCSTATGRTSLALCHTWRQRSRDDFKRLAYWLWLACFSLEDLIANMNGMIGIKSMTIYDNKCPLHYFQCDEIFLNTAIFSHRRLKHDARRGIFHTQVQLVLSWFSQGSGWISIAFYTRMSCDHWRLTYASRELDLFFGKTINMEIQS